MTSESSGEVVSVKIAGKFFEEYKCEFRVELSASPCGAMVNALARFEMSSAVQRIGGSIPSRDCIFLFKMI